MQVNSPDSPSNELSSDGPDKSDAPRKRSKVSRACDACRRKKVRCDAEFSSSISKVTKICTNCSKVGDKCLFSRIPLKRGPSKGYLKDLSDRLETSNDASKFADPSLSRPRSKSIDVAGYSVYAQNGSNKIPQAPLSPMSTTQVKPVLHRLKFSSTSGTKSPIILPPLLGSQPAVGINPPIGYHSPQNISGVASHGVEPPDPRIVGPLWKVPYEMPTSSATGSNSSSPGAFNGVDIDSRRSSVDSVSSVSTVGSRSRMTPFHALGSQDPDGTTTSPDAEDVSKTNTNSPRNSVSSLSSLNGRMTKNLQLNIDSPEGPFELNVPRFQTSQYGFINSKPMSMNGKPNSIADPKLAAMSIVCPIPLNSLDHNLNVYYSQFHLSFPILPTDRSSIYQAITELSPASSVCLEVAQLFNAALNNLINCQFITLEASKHLLLRALSIYPLKIFIPVLSEKVLTIYSASLILINYVIALRGESFPLAISSALGIFNDMDILKNLKNFKKNSLSAPHIDDIQIYLPHLYSCLEILDSCFALSFGKQHQTSTFLLGNSEVLNEAYSSAYSDTWFYGNFSIAKSLRALVEFKDGNVQLESGKQSRLLSVLLAPGEDPDSSSFNRLFSVLLNETYLLHDFLTEVSEFLHVQKDKLMDDDDEVAEHIHDYHLKTSRLVKKLSQSILKYANYVSTSFFQSRSHNGTELSEFNHPFFNISYSRALNSIKLSKKLIDLLTKHVRDGELFTRSLKINNNLSIAFNLLMGNLNNNFNIVTNAKSFLNDQNKSGTTSPNPTGVYGLGICCMNSLSKKVFDLSFNETSPTPSTTGPKNDMNAWKTEILAITEKYVKDDLQDGWL